MEEFVSFKGKDGENDFSAMEASINGFEFFGERLLREGVSHESFELGRDYTLLYNIIRLT